MLAVDTPVISRLMSFSHPANIRLMLVALAPALPVTPTLETFTHPSKRLERLPPEMEAPEREAVSREVMSENMPVLSDETSPVHVAGSVSAPCAWVPPQTRVFIPEQPANARRMFALAAQMPDTSALPSPVHPANARSMEAGAAPEAEPEMVRVEEEMRVSGKAPSKRDSSVDVAPPPVNEPEMATARGVVPLLRPAPAKPESICRFAPVNDPVMEMLVARAVAENIDIADTVAPVKELVMVILSAPEPCAKLRTRASGPVNEPEMSKVDRFSVLRKAPVRFIDARVVKDPVISTSFTEEPCGG